MHSAAGNASVKKPKVILVNSYAMDDAYELWKRGVYPGQHLWGSVELQRRQLVDLVILEHEKYSWLNTLGRCLKINFLDQQLRALWALRRADLLYSPYGVVNTKLILLLKWLGLLKKPVVALVHHRMFAFHGNSMASQVKRRMLRQYDALGFLSKRLKRELMEELKLTPEEEADTFHSVEWGVELAFYEKARRSNTPECYSYVVSAGGTHRDYGTLVAAFRQLEVPLKIYCGDDLTFSTKDLPPNVEVVKRFVGYDELVKVYAEAKMILIPLRNEPNGTQGLTSLYDALGMGKPVIMSQNPNVDLDIEKEGIGRWVRVGNANDWVKAVKELNDNPELLREMGENSLKLARSRFNTDKFADDLHRMFNQAIQKRSAIVTPKPLRT